MFMQSHDVIYRHVIHALTKILGYRTGLDDLELIRFVAIEL